MAARTASILPIGKSVPFKTMSIVYAPTSLMLYRRQMLNAILRSMTRREIFQEPLESL
jgi:hypothetical protein